MIDHDIPYCIIDYKWEISTGNGIISTCKVCKAYKVKICGRKLEVDIFVINTRGYDVILDMTWINKYHAGIDCKDKSITFKIPQQPEFKFVNESDEAETVRPAVCTNLEVLVESIPVVDEFLDAFPKKLPGLSPDRDIKFSIDLIPGAEPISKAPCRMAPKELVIMKQQLEFSDKGFIRPSASPWGAPIMMLDKRSGGKRLCIDYRE